MARQHCEDMLKHGAWRRYEETSRLRIMGSDSSTTGGGLSTAYTSYEGQN
jgi:hypothetical protein